MRHLALALSAAVFSLPACAEILTFEYTGVVNYVREYNMTTERDRGVVSSALLPGSVSVGNTFKGSFSFDTAMSLQYSELTYASYYGPVPASTLTLNHSGQTVTPQATGAQVMIIDGTNGFGDSFSIHTSALGESLTFSFFIGSGDLLSNLSIPGSLNLDDIDYPSVHLYKENGKGMALHSDGILTSLTQVTAVPEPSSYAMLFAGLAIVAGGAAHRRNRIVPLKDLEA